MSKLGYTWYPKDWGNSEAVFELNLSERGLYRELIDMAMMNDNTIKCNYKVWARKFDIDMDDIFLILDKLSELKLINYVINEDRSILDTIFIPSCEARLNLSRGGKNGGKKSRKSKPTLKPLVSLIENKSKPTPNQIESKLKEKESVIEDKSVFTPEQFLSWWNDSRTKLLQKPSNSNYLSSHDKNYLEILTNRYKGEDFGKAFHNLCNDKWANESNQIIPKHFLKPENFDKYLQIEQKPLLTKKQKINRGWAI